MTAARRLRVVVLSGSRPHLWAFANITYRHMRARRSALEPAGSGTRVRGASRVIAHFTAERSRAISGVIALVAPEHSIDYPDFLNVSIKVVEAPGAVPSDVFVVDSLDIVGVETARDEVLAALTELTGDE